MAVDDRVICAGLGGLRLARNNGYLNPFEKEEPVWIPSEVFLFIPTTIHNIHTYKYARIRICMYIYIYIYIYIYNYIYCGVIKLFT